MIETVKNVMGFLMKYGLEEETSFMFEGQLISFENGKWTQREFAYEAESQCDLSIHVNSTALDILAYRSRDFLEASDFSKDGFEDIKRYCLYEELLDEEKDRILQAYPRLRLNNLKSAMLSYFDYEDVYSNYEEFEQEVQELQMDIDDLEETVLERFLIQKEKDICDYLADQFESIFENANIELVYNEYTCFECFVKG